MNRITLILVGLVLAFAVAAVVLFLLFSATQATLTTDTRSSDFSDDQTKIEFLEKYLKMYSEIEATEFHVRYQDNSGFVPGPSEWDMQVVMKMSQDNLPRWTTDLQKADQVDLSWGEDLLPQEERWTIRSKPTIYTRGKTLVAVFEPEGIVFKRVKAE